jgi:hypothetical protein
LRNPNFIDGTKGDEQPDPAPVGNGFNRADGCGNNSSVSPPEPSLEPTVIGGAGFAARMLSALSRKMESLGLVFWLISLFVVVPFIVTVFVLFIGSLLE